MNEGIRRAKKRRASRKRQTKAEAKLLDRAAEKHSEMLNPRRLSVLREVGVAWVLWPRTFVFLYFLWARTLVVFVCCLACVESKGLILLVMLGRRSGSAACR